MPFPVRCGVIILIGWLAWSVAAPVGAFQNDPVPYPFPNVDKITFSAYRCERANPYWVNLELPSQFFSGVEQTSDIPRVYRLQGIHYGFQVAGWPTERLMLRSALSIEANSLTDAHSENQHIARPGDLEFGGAYLGVGKRTSALWAGADGWLRLPTGTDPFELQYPVLTTGKGAVQYALGVVAGEKLGRFSLFQSIHYEKTGSVDVLKFGDQEGPGLTYHWPDLVHAECRLDFSLLKRSKRFVDVFYAMRMRKSFETRLNDEVLLSADRLFFSTAGLRMGVDPDMTVQCQMVYFPAEFLGTRFRPDYGTWLMVTLDYHPFHF